MSYFRKLDQQLEALFALLGADQRWLVLVNADPDALGSALALKRILKGRVALCDVAHVNEIRRPDNLAMIRLLRIPLVRLTPEIAAGYDRFALVDSQPHHHPDFQQVPFTVVVDHHPRKDAPLAKVPFVDVRTDYGANSTIFAEYLYNLKIRPGRLLATAMLYGIKTDTASFERSFFDEDVKAFRWLTKFADQIVLRKIVRSEFTLNWLKYFALAFSKLKRLAGGLHVFLGEVDNPDILVVLADFFMRVHEISWTSTAGTCKGRLVVVFRGDGLAAQGRNRGEVPDLGETAERLFGEYGMAGGHKAMARAEADLSRLNGEEPEAFVWRMLERCQKSGRGGSGCAVAPSVSRT